ncbi:uncharacterized protein LOC122931270 isoform X1 [Bufo gargarizans]|uniref:uncharacterized protein LOC122931270 isoform X1 n=1 Tax=Bufo gargarizans TaxID=30331 RepID=UPI001CF5AC19|nr:uncharacterized protein LOC122931270 isoform X1 [Bufo gargarizans]
MWWPVPGLLLDASPEMPHAEKNLTHHVHDSSIEPCLKKSRPDYSSSWASRDTDWRKEREADSQRWSPFTRSEERYHQSDRSESEGGVDAKYDSDSRRYHLGQGDVDERDCNRTNQHPFVLSGQEKDEHHSDVAFSGTSSSFIGPQCRPLPQKNPVPKVTCHPDASSFKIATVEVGKLATQSKGKDGMDYELRQFYKELNELEADEQTKEVTCRDVDVKQHISPYPDETPATHPSNHHHGPVPISHPFGPFPSKNFASLACHVTEGPRPHLHFESPSLPQFPSGGQAPYHPRPAMPPPRFKTLPPPTFIVPYGPPPPRFNYPMTFPRESNALPSQPSRTFNYNIRNGQPQWLGSPVPPENSFTSQRIPYDKPFSQGTRETRWPDLQHNDLCRQEDGQFGGRLLPNTGGNVSHEQCPGRFRDTSRRKMVLLRGVPGSGKSTLARTLLLQSPDGIVLSTDDYFCQDNGYTYDVKLLGDAHSWNQNRARRALDHRQSPVIIDNTNIQGWEMKPYVQMAVDRGYNIEFLEPDTWWKQDADELEKRNKHRVPRDKISQMLERFEYDVTVPVVMNSVEPRRIRPNHPPPEARPRTLGLKGKRHRKRYPKNGNKIVSRKQSLSLQEDEGLEKLAVEDPRSGCIVQDCLMDVEGTGKVQVKIDYSGKEGYLYDFLATFLSRCSVLSTAALFGRVSDLLELMDKPRTPLKPEIGILVSHRHRYLLSSSLLSLVVDSVLCKGTNHVRPSFSWLQACSKGLHVTDLPHSRGQDIINTGLDLYCSLIKLIAGHTLDLYGIKCSKPQHFNQLTFTGSENQDGQSMQKSLECKRFKDPYLEPEISEQESVQSTDCTKILVESGQITPRPHKRLRRIYKLAPTFQHPRILSETQISAWKHKCAIGSRNLSTETNTTVAMQNPLEENPVGNLVNNECKDDLTPRDASVTAKDASVYKGVCEVEPYPAPTKCLDDHENSVMRCYSGLLPGAQSCPGLYLPEQFARQLVELFGSPGIELDTSRPKDLIVPLGYDLARRVYLKWKKSLEAKYKLLPAK